MKSAPLIVNEEPREGSATSEPSPIESAIPLQFETMSTWKAVKTYKRTLCWAAFVGFAGIAWGYDMLVGAGLLSSPRFRQDFGYRYNDEYVLQAKWQVAFNTGSSVGGFIGCILTGYLSERLGRRLMLAIACTNSFAWIFAQVFACSNVILLLGKIMNGISLGSYLTIAPSYMVESCPVQLRGITTSGVNLFMGIGQLLANGVVKAFGGRDSSLAYRIPFAFQWIFVVIILCGIPFVPESPVWLLRHHHEEGAANALRRLGHPDVDAAMLDVQTAVASELKEGSGSYRDCFREPDRRRTEIAMGSFAVTQLVGCVFVIGYSSYFFELGGLGTEQAFSLGLGVSALGIVGNIFSWFLINSAGRRITFLLGCCGLFACLLLIGILDFVHASAVIWVQSTAMIIYNCIYFLSVGPIAWALFAEIGSARLRSRTVGLGIVVQNLFGILLTIVIPYLINPDEANLKGKIGFIFAGTTALSIIWAYFRIPETKGRSADDLNRMFVAGVSAREFKTYKLRSAVDAILHSTGIL